MKEWKIIDDEYNGYGCENYIVNNINVAGYSHTLIKNDPNGEYRGYINLPILRNKKIAGSREYVKATIESFVNKFINQISKE